LGSCREGQAIVGTQRLWNEKSRTLRSPVTSVVKLGESASKKGETQIKGLRLDYKRSPEGNCTEAKNEAQITLVGPRGGGERKKRDLGGKTQGVAVGDTEKRVQLGQEERDPSK